VPLRNGYGAAISAAPTRKVTEEPEAFQ
jgi:hypothetical protein